MKIKIIAALVVIVAASNWQVEAQTSEQNPQIITNLTLVGDETSVSALKAYSRKYIEQPVIIVGSLMVGNYYNYKYQDANDTHFSLNFTGRTKDLKPTEQLTIYAERNMAASLVDVVLKAQQERHSKLVRLKVKITSRSFYGSDKEFNENAELIDWQFPKPDKSGWEIWEKENEIKRLNEARQIQLEQLDQQRRITAKVQEKKGQEAQVRALKWHQELAAKGDAFGQFEMGQRYLKGDGVEKDEAKAKEYFTKSAVQGNKDAAKTLEKLKSP